MRYASAGLSEVASFSKSASSSPPPLLPFSPGRSATAPSEAKKGARAFADPFAVRYVVCRWLVYFTAIFLATPP